MMHDFTGKPVRVFVVWEPVLATDWSSPSTAVLRRVSDGRAAQFWDKGRLISNSMHPHNRRGVVWDYVAVYPSGAVWENGPPEPLYQGGTVIEAADDARTAIAKALNDHP